MNDDDNTALLNDSDNPDASTGGVPRSSSGVVFEAGAGGGGYKTGFNLGSTIVCVLMLAYATMLVVYFVWSHSYLVFTQTQPSAAFNGLTPSNVPFYNSPQLNAHRSEIYASFDYWLWMTDYLLIYLPPYVIGVLFISVLDQLRTGGVLGVVVVGIVFGLLELFKAVYWTIVLADQRDPSSSGCSFCCGSVQYCVSHDPGVAPGKPAAQFWVAVIFAYLSTIVSFLLICLPSIIKIGKLDRVQVTTISGRAGSGSGGNAANDLALNITEGSTTVVQRRSASSAGGNKSSPPPLPAKNIFLKDAR